MNKPRVILGDSIGVMRRMPEASIDAICTDPPYGLGFMGKAWDDLPPGEEWARECLRVLKPGGYLLAFGGTRTWHRLAVAVEDAGFEIRDSIAWMYGSGFPKSLDVSKAIDKRGGNAHLAPQIGAAIKAARLAHGWTIGRADAEFCGGSTLYSWFEGRPAGQQIPTPEVFASMLRQWPELAPVAALVAEAERAVTGARAGTVLAVAPGEGRERPPVDLEITAPATAEAAKWQGWGTALKPAHEPIVVARKPLRGTVAANVLAHGTGAMNIDGCRVGYRSESDRDSARPQGQATALNGALAGKAQSCQSGTPTTDSSTTAPTTGTSATSPMGFAPNAAGSQRKAFTPNQSDLGRWPANVVLDEDQAEALDAQSGALKSGNRAAGKYAGLGYNGSESADFPAVKGDQGGASRFFYVARKDDECNPASTAESSSSQPSELAGSAPSGAATSARLDTARLTDSPSTSATASESSTSAPSGTPVTPTTDERFSLEPQPARRTPTLDLASGAAANAPTGTTMTTTSRSRFDGFADRATSNGTRPNSEPGDLDSRFKYCAKAPKNERPVVNGVAHPTVKPLSLMRWLVRLVTPTGGTVLDPFAGSGTTIEAAMLEGFSVIGIEREAEYLPLIGARIKRCQQEPA